MIHSPGSDLHQSLITLAKNAAYRAELEPILGEYCHQSRNRLNSLKLSIHLAKRLASQEGIPHWEALEHEYCELASQIDRIEAVCRPMNLSLVTLDLNLLFADRQPQWTQIMAQHGHHLEVDAGSGPNQAAFDVAKLGAALDALVNWRAEQGGTTLASLRWGVELDQAQISWSEALAACGDERQDTTSLSSSWALPLIIRVVTEHGGSLHVDPIFGLKILMRWPA